jgi:hypothetical protein
MLIMPYIEGCISLIGDSMDKRRKKKTETMDICDKRQREEILKTDEITTPENAFMAGR